MDIITSLAAELSLDPAKVEATVALIDDGCTIPFIARYRKEVTGSLDDTQLRKLYERLCYLRSLEERRDEVRRLIDEQGKLTPEISKALDDARILTEIEDIYRPFRPKRRTRATVAVERGLSPLAEAIFAQKTPMDKLDELAKSLVDPDKEVSTPDDAYAGACDIVAEQISDNADWRKFIRGQTLNGGEVVTKQAKDEDSVYSMYYDYRCRLNRLPGHRVLAINRGEKEEFLKVTIEAPRDQILARLSGAVIKKNSPCRELLYNTVVDSYDRLIAPSIEREIRGDLFDNASEGAIQVFELNLKHLLLQPPLKDKTVLGFDPGYAHGCKLAVTDRTGKVLDTAVIYITGSKERLESAKRIVKNLIVKHSVDVVAIGNGTASRESEKFIADLLSELHGETKYIIVSEAGASVYSASKAAADEFPDYDVMQRSAISIARRLQDPLAELVKIDPKAIGVGQYQHDMKPARLDEALGGVVEDCVNSVGVDINTASCALLSYVSGITAASAKNIVAQREEKGEFKSRAEIKKVPRIGPKAYEMCAGFLRVPGSDEILDNTGVHPESYAAAKTLLSELEYTEDDVRARRLGELRSRSEKYGIKRLCDKLNIGEPTLRDIIAELEKPGRDPRDSMPPPTLRTDVLELSDLKPDMRLTGTVRNVTDFGVFVDIGVHQDGLVHISEMSDKRISHPSDIAAVGDIVEVKVLSVDVAKKRISLSMKK